MCNVQGERLKIPTREWPSRLDRRIRRTGKQRRTVSGGKVGMDTRKQMKG